MLKIVKGPIWVSDAYNTNHNTSYDGVEYNEEQSKILFASFFFISNLKAEHTRDVYNIINLLAELGGIYCSFYALMKSFGATINSSLYANKMIKELIFKKITSTTLEKYPSLKTKATEI